MVTTVVSPEGIPGPAGTVYVTTSRDAVDEDWIPDEATLITDGPPTEDPGTVTVRGWREPPVSEEPYVVILG